MHELRVSDELYAQVSDFKQVVEAVIEEKISFADVVESIMKHGIDSMLTALLGPLDQATLLRSFQQLDSRYPAQVYSHIADMLENGSILHDERNNLKRQLGFPTSQDTDNDK